MKTDWIMIRVSVYTRSLLEAERDSMERADLMKLRVLSRDTRGRVSLDQVIQELVYERRNHIRRARESNARRAFRRRNHTPILPNEEG